MNIIFVALGDGSVYTDAAVYHGHSETGLSNVTTTFHVPVSIQQRNTVCSGHFPIKISNHNMS